MTTYIKRIIIVNDSVNPRKLLKGSVKLLKEDNRVKLYAEFIINSQFNYENYAWILCGENEIISNCMTNACRFNLDLKYDFAFERGASFCVFDMLSSEIICYGEYGAPLLDFNGITKYAKKNCKNYQENYETAPSASGEQNCNFRYDDESIATEDYFKINESEILFNQTIDLESQNKKQGTKKENEKLSLLDEESLSHCKNYEYYEKIKRRLEELFNTHERHIPLTKVIKNGEFVKVCYDNGRFYYVGIIKNQENPEYICYGVKGEYGKTPCNFDSNCCFVPKSSFDLTGEGYYLIFQSAHTGEIVKK